MGLEKVLNDIKREGKQEGKREGKREGMLEGIKTGIQTGREKEREQVARNLIGMGMDNAMIAQATGLAREQVQELRLR